MRGRPKVVLARNYEEAMALYTKYSDNVLGVISDVRFPIDGVKDSEAGLKLLRNIHKDNPYLPLIVESTESANREKAEAEGFRFVDKNSKKMSIDLRAIMEEHMGFGDFIFRDPKTKAEIMRIHSLKELRVSARAPMTRLSAPRMMLLPAPVSPVSTVMPSLRSMSSARISA